MAEFVQEAKKNQIILITTDHWSSDYFTKILLPQGRYCDTSVDDIVFCDIASGAWEENLEKLMALLRTYGSRSQCYACTDVAMQLYSVAHALLKDEVDIVGAEFVSFFLATNKLACRKLVDGCTGIESVGVTSEMEMVPNLSVTGFFKPLADCGSNGVFKREVELEYANPLLGEVNPMAMERRIKELASKYDELVPYLDNRLVGLVEEYIPLEGRITVSVDGFVHNGQIFHYGMSENVYFKDRPEEFDCIISPALSLVGRPELTASCYALYDRVVLDLVRRGVNYQFVDVEMFILPSGRVEVMEVNCRTFSNQLPIFSMLYGRDGCMFSGALDLLKKELPPAETQNASAPGRCGACFYMDDIEGAPAVVRSADGECVFYSCQRPAYKAHVYVVGNLDEGEIRQKAAAFYEECKAAAAAAASSSTAAEEE